MIENRRTWFILLAVLALVVVFVFVFALVRIFGGDEDADNANKESTPFTEPVGGNMEQAQPQKDPEQQAVESLARLFVERIGSYSSQSNFQNIDDLKPLMTARVQDWAEGLKNIAVDSSAYRGITTRVLTLDMLDWNSNVSAAVKISTQRQEQTDGVEDRIYYQDVEVHLVYQDGGWLVDGIYWGEERE